MQTMKAVRIERYGGEDVMALAEMPKPTPRAGEVLVKVKAAAVNPVDWKIREGLGEMFGLKFPAILGCEVGGTIEGSADAGFNEGDEVYGYLGTHTGAFAEFVAAPASEFVLKPANVDLNVAVSIPVAGLTAWQGIFDLGKLESGQRILITGASGAVGSVAVQLAKDKGAHVIGTGSGRNEEFVKNLGADEFIDYTKTKFEEHVSGVDVVFDTVGGDTQERAFGTLKPGGFLISTVNPPSADKAREAGVTIGMVAMMPKAEQLAELNRILTEGKLKTRVSTVLPLTEFQQALRLCKEGHADGKIILRVQGE